MELAIPVLPVDDLSLAKRFYVDALGFEVRFEVLEDGTTGLLGVRRGSIQITLDCPMDGHGRKACVSLQVESADQVDSCCGRAWAACVRNLMRMSVAVPLRHG